MNKRNTSISGILLLVLLIGILLAACGQSSSDAASNPPTAISGGSGSTPDGSTLLQERCTVCHSLGRVTSTHGSASQWQGIVAQMITKGAQLNAQEKQTLVDYLAQTYP